MLDAVQSKPQLIAKPSWSCKQNIKNSCIGSWKF